MNRTNLREAKAALSAVIEAAEHGEATTLTKHGKAVAMIVPIDEARKIYPDKPVLIDYLTKSIRESMSRTSAER